MKKLVITEAPYEEVLVSSKPRCLHPQFMDIGEEVKQKEDLVRQPVRWGRRIMCAFCGERRILWTDGEVEIL